jgi:hypothetical protein
MLFSPNTRGAALEFNNNYVINYVKNAPIRQNQRIYFKIQGMIYPSVLFSIKR